MKRIRFAIVLPITGGTLWLLVSALEHTPGRGLAAWGNSSQQAPAATPVGEMKPYTEIIPGTNVKFTMVPIQGGTFTMGSHANEPGHTDDESPQHLVTIHPFWIEQTETTWDEYGVFALRGNIPKENPAKQESGSNQVDAITQPTPPYRDPTFGFGREGHPAINMTHHAAMEYTRWLSAKTGKDYRLPTEAEWEYACRAGSETPFYFGSDATQLGDYAWDLDNSDEQPHAVAQKKPNAWGLYDMLGNVAEWVLDEYDKDFYRASRTDVPLLEPVMLPTQKKYPNVVRGGSWNDEADRVRCAARQASSPDWSGQDPQAPRSIWWHTDATFVGFRVVRPLQEEEKLKGLRSLVKKYE